MKFNKFGAFPKTNSPKNESKTAFDLSSIVKILPSLFSNKSAEEPKKEDSSNKQENNVYKPSNKDAYNEYIAKHNEFIKKSKLNK